MPCRYYRDICCCPLPLKSVLLLHWQWSWSGRPWVASLDKFLREVCGRSSQLAAAAAAPAQRGRGGPQSRRGEEWGLRSEECSKKYWGRVWTWTGLAAGCAAELRTLNIKQQRNLGINTPRLWNLLNIIQRIYPPPSLWPLLSRDSFSHFKLFGRRGFKGLSFRTNILRIFLYHFLFIFLNLSFCMFIWLRLNTRLSALL